MTTPSQSSVRPADEETVQGLAAEVLAAVEEATVEGISGRSVFVTRLARAVVASEQWQRLVRERDEAREDLDLALTAASRLAADDGRRLSLDEVLAHFGIDRAALRGDAEEASDGR